MNTVFLCMTRLCQINTQSWSLGWWISVWYVTLYNDLYIMNWVPSYKNHFRFLFLKLCCVHVFCESCFVYGSQSSTLWSWFSPLIKFSGTQLRLPDFHKQVLLSYKISSHTLCIMLKEKRTRMYILDIFVFILNLK